MRRLVPGVLLASAASASLVLLGLAPAGAASQAAPTGPVTANPAATPQLNATGTTEQVRQLVQCGGTMYAVGTFTSVKKGSTIYARNNAFSFSATAPYTVTSWNPNVNGIVNSIAFNGTNCADAYLGGKFTSVDGTKVDQHRRGQHLDRRRGHGLRAHRERPGRDAARGRRAHPGRRLLHHHQRQQHQVHDQPEPLHRQRRRVHQPEHLRELPVPRRVRQRHPGVQSVAQPWRHARPGDGRLHLGRRRSPGSRSSCSTWPPARRR